MSVPSAREGRNPVARPPASSSSRADHGLAVRDLGDDPVERQGTRPAALQVADRAHARLQQLDHLLGGEGPPVGRVETAAAHHLLPPQQAAWIPAGLPHRTTLRRVRTVSVFFAPEMVAGWQDRVRVLPAVPVVREMILYAARWPITRPASDPSADAFFRALAVVITELLDHELPLWLPTSRDPVVAAAMHYTGAHLRSVTAAEVGRAVGLSERTLRRRFPVAAGMTWRRYLLHSRLRRAMALLAEPGPSILEVATSVEFDNAGAFARAFRAATGESPSAYRRRAT